MTRFDLSFPPVVSPESSDSNAGQSVSLEAVGQWGSVTLHAVELTPPDFFPETLRESCYVYLLVTHRDRGVASASMINCGPHACGDQLLDKLDELGVSPDAVDRVVATNWDVRTLGNIARFPNALLLCLSPDRVRPYNFAAIIESQRHRLRSLLDELYEARATSPDTLSIPTALPERHHDASQQLEEFFARYYDPLPSVLPFAPLRNGSLLNLQGVTFHVADHSPYHKGQLLLLEERQKLLFGLAIPSIGLPRPFYSPAAVVPMVERVAAMQPSMIATNHFGLETQPQWALKRTRSFTKSFIDNAPTALRKKPTLLEFVRQNFGYEHDDLVDYLFELVKYQDLLNELARDEEIAIEGSGIAGRRYGVNVVDSRHPRLQT